VIPRVMDKKCNLLTAITSRVATNVLSREVTTAGSLTKMIIQQNKAKGSNPDCTVV